MSQDLKEIYIWDIKYNLLSVDEIVAIVTGWLKEGRRGIHLTGVNAETITIAHKDNMLRDAILDSDIVNVDSFLPAFFLKKKGYKIDRVATPDVLEAFFRDANDKFQKVYFLGAKQTTLDLLKGVIAKQYPNINIVGMHDGYYSSEQEELIANEISQLSPDYLFIALPSPMKEKFILKYKKRLNVGVFYGVGGAFDAKAGVLKRPPKWLQGHGLEGAFRLVRTPKTMIKRIRLNFDFVRYALRMK